MTTTDPTSGTSAVTGATAATPQNPKATLGKDDFLRLLVTQLKYQDPLKPSDQSQFMSQMAQFSTVEGINNLQSQLATSQAFGLIGKDVTYLTGDGTDAAPTVASGTVDSISIVDGKVSVNVGDAKIGFDDIVQVAGA
jgi:flagellar basal-body rod modification protein FlgD